MEDSDIATPMDFKSTAQERTGGDPYLLREDTNLDVIQILQMTPIFGSVGDMCVPRSRYEGFFEPSLVSVLQEMGFTETRAHRGLFYTGNSSVEAAMEWIIGTYRGAHFRHLLIGFHLTTK